MTRQLIELCRMRHGEDTTKWWRIVREAATGAHFVEWISDLALSRGLPWLIMCQFASEMLGSNPSEAHALAVLKRLVDQYMSGEGVVTGRGGRATEIHVDGGAITGEGSLYPPVTLKPEYLELVEAARAWVSAEKTFAEAVGEDAHSAEAHVHLATQRWQAAAKQLVARCCRRRSFHRWI